MELLFFYFKLSNPGSQALQFAAHVIVGIGWNHGQMPVLAGVQLNVSLASSSREGLNFLIAFVSHPTAPSKLWGRLQGSKSAHKEQLSGKR